MKPFNLDLAKSGVPIVTRDGRPARFVAHLPEVHAITARVIFVAQRADGLWELYDCCESGSWVKNEESRHDLFHLSEKKSGWINLYRINSTGAYTSSTIYNSKEGAEAQGKPGNSYITTIQINWEE